jgi:excisionase family DNA binding protein
MVAEPSPVTRGVSVVVDTGYSCCGYGGLVMARTGVLKQAVQVRAGADQARSAGEVADAMAMEPDDAVVLMFPDGRQVPLPASLVDVVRASAKELAEGHGVTVLPADAVLTPAEVGELLGLSRPFVVRLLDEGEIPSERLPGSRHRRVRLTDVLSFADRRDRREQGRRRVADAVTDAELPY